MKQSKINLILAHLQTTGSITPREAIIYYDYYRLAVGILRLRRKGYNIVSEPIEKAGGAVRYRLVKA